MQTAETFGSLSTAKRLQVGAIVVKDNRIISIGYNGMPSGWTNECEDVIGINSAGQPALQTKPEVIHAEANAIAKLAKCNESGNNASIYITHAPCIECAKLIYSSGITSVYYKNKYRAENGIDFLTKCGIEVEQI